MAEAWKITYENRRQLFWYGFFPSLFSLGVGVIIIYLQALLLSKSSIFSDTPESIFQVMRPFIDWIFSPETPTVSIISTGVLVFLASYLFPIICEGAIIAMTKEYKNTGKMSKGLSKGFMNFLPLFELSLFRNSIKPFSIILQFLFFFRVLGKDALVFLKPIFIIIFFLGSIFTFLLTYASHYIVLEKKEFGDSLLLSMKKVAYFLSSTLKILLLFFLIELRIIFNVVIVFLIPFILLSLGGQTLGDLAIAGVGVLILVVSAAVSGIIFSFGNIVWTLTFLQLKDIRAKDEKDQA